MYRNSRFRKALKTENKIDNDNDDEEEDEEDEEEEEEEEEEDEEEEDDGEKWRPDSLARYGSPYPTERPPFPRL